MEKTKRFAHTTEEAGSRTKDGTTVDKVVLTLERKKCISCGAEQQDDGSLPCGH